MTDAPDVFRIDREAVRKAGSMAGQYLDEIGVTDLAELTADQWEQFCFKMIGFALMFAAKPPANRTPPF